MTEGYYIFTTVEPDLLQGQEVSSPQPLHSKRESGLTRS
jgi:hypothetical protein